MAQWNTNTVPKCKSRKWSDEVLVTVEQIGCDGKVYRRVIRAVYSPYPRHAQGWYEVCDYFEDYSYSEITDKVTAWMKLPKPYEPRVKELTELMGGTE